MTFTAANFTRSRTIQKRCFVGLILLIIVVLLLVGALPRWKYNRNWGYAPTGVLTLVLVIVVLLLLGHLPYSF
jgi:hypothetical protein